MAGGTLWVQAVKLGYAVMPLAVPAPVRWNAIPGSHFDSQLCGPTCVCNLHSLDLDVVDEGAELDAKGATPRDLHVLGGEQVT